MPTAAERRARIAQLQARLCAVADDNKRVWFNRYLKGAIEYRGVATLPLDGLLREWLDETGAARESAAAQLVLIRRLFAERFAEDKFIAILWLRILAPQLSGDAILRVVEAAFAAGDIHDWSTCDWLCVRVLDGLALRCAKSARRIGGWRTAKSMWQRRAAIVALRASARAGRRHKLIGAVINTLARSDERFIQTGIGWCLADLSREYPQTARALFARHFHQLSREVIDRHAKHLPDHPRMRAAKRRQLREAQCAKLT